MLPAFVLLYFIYYAHIIITAIALYMKYTYFTATNRQTNTEWEGSSVQQTVVF